MLGGNIGADDDGRENDLGRAAAPPGPGAGSRALPEPTALRLLWRATSAQRLPASATDVVVWHRGGSCPPFRPLPMWRRAEPSPRSRRSCPTAAPRNMSAPSPGWAA